jgi:hypothetical protein
MILTRPTGEIDEYDRINSLVDEENRIIADRSMEIVGNTGWPPLRARMAAIVEWLSMMQRWVVDEFAEAQRRAMVYARWRQSVKGMPRGRLTADRQT